MPRKKSTAKPTEKMVETLDYMKDGRELASSLSFGTLKRRWWIQRDGAGKGGPARYLSATQVNGLILRGLIEPKKKGGLSSFTTWKLTEISG